MNLSDVNAKQIKKWLLLGGAGVFVLFLVISFFSSYYKYKTEGPRTEEPVLYDEESFSRLHQELLKDKPETKEARELLQDIVKSTNKNSRLVSSSRNVDNLYSKESFDTLAVNCGVLLEKYRELVLKYHELKKQVDKGKAVKSVPRKKRSKPRLASKSSSRRAANGNSGNFDYTKYIRGSTKNELSNEGSNTGLNSNAQFEWATLTLTQTQRIYDRSVVTFDVAENFEFDGVSIPHLSKVEGVAQVSRGRARVYISFKKLYKFDQVFDIEGEIFSLDRSRGINVFLQGESSVAEGIKREATDLIGLIDPTRTTVSRRVLQDTDVGREVFGTVEAGTMVLAKIRKR